jgi:hypothetical protein
MFPLLLDQHEETTIVSHQTHPSIQIIQVILDPGWEAPLSILFSTLGTVPVAQRQHAFARLKGPPSPQMPQWNASQLNSGLSRTSSATQSLHCKLRPVSVRNSRNASKLASRCLGTTFLVLWYL